MNCSQCHTELPDSATFCPRCGFSIRQSTGALTSATTSAYMSPTSYMQASSSLPLPDPQPQEPYTALPSVTPVAPVQTPFSYLPSGAPPWPTTVPQGLFTRNQSQQSGASEIKPEGKNRHSARNVLRIAALIVFTPLLGAAITLGALYANGQLAANTSAQQSVRVTVPTPVPTATATPSANSTPASNSVPTPAPTAAVQTNQLPTPTAFQKTSSTDINVTFKYPSDWVAETPQKSSSSTYLGVHPKQQIGITFIIARFSDSTSSSIQSADEVNQANVANIGSLNVKDIQPVSAANTQPLIGGVKWVESDATFLDTSGNKTHFATISVQHNKLYYNIIVFTPDIYYSEAMKKYIQPMLDSLQFLS